MIASAALRPAATEALLATTCGATRGSVNNKRHRLTLSINAQACLC
jgi:hypothetical protein